MEKRRKKAEVIPESLGQFLDPAYSYNFWQNPDVVRSKEDALKDGINCVSLAHLALKDLFGYELPAELGCAELYQDKKHFEPVADMGQARGGDLVWFGIENPPKAPEDIRLYYGSAGELLNWQEFPVKHVTVHTGIEEAGEPLLLHATNYNGGKNQLWRLSEFKAHRRYQKLYGITRLAHVSAMSA